MSNQPLQVTVTLAEAAPRELTPAIAGASPRGLAHLSDPASVRIVTPDGGSFIVDSKQTFIALSDSLVTDVTVEPAPTPLPFDAAVELLRAELERLGITPDEKAGSTLLMWSTGTFRNDEQIRGRAMATGVPLGPSTRLHIQMLPHASSGWVLSLTFALTQSEREHLNPGKQPQTPLEEPNPLLESPGGDL